jgi:hypothetical protein
MPFYPNGITPSTQELEMAKLFLNKSLQGIIGSSLKEIEGMDLLAIEVSEDHTA